jgi:hypothetical protein
MLPCMHTYIHSIECEFNYQKYVNLLICKLKHLSYALDAACEILYLSSFVVRLGFFSFIVLRGKRDEADGSLFRDKTV